MTSSEQTARLCRQSQLVLVGLHPAGSKEMLRESGLMVVFEAVNDFWTSWRISYPGG